MLAPALTLQASQGSQGPLQVLGQLRYKVEALQAAWVDEAQCLGMKSRPIELLENHMCDALPAKHSIYGVSSKVNVSAWCLMPIPSLLDSLCIAF